MSLSHRYRNFGGENTSGDEDVEGMSEEIEDLKLQAFETGYQAGWDDATKAQSSQKDKISSELAQNLLEMSLTYHEALSKLTENLESTICLVIEKLLPELVRTALTSHILEQVKALIDGKNNQFVEIVVHPQNIYTVRNVVSGNLPDQFEIIAEDSLGAGQAFIRMGSKEKQVDLDTVIQEVSKAMTAFFHESAQEINDG